LVLSRSEAIRAYGTVIRINYSS